jgi:hypothetical protein
MVGGLWFCQTWIRGAPMHALGDEVLYLLCRPSMNKKEPDAGKDPGCLPRSYAVRGVAREDIVDDTLKACVTISLVPKEPYSTDTISLATVLKLSFRNLLHGLADW